MTVYAQEEHKDFAGAVQQALADAPLQSALERLTNTLMAGNRRSLAALPDSDALRSYAKRIKEHTLAHLDTYLTQLEDSIKRAGGHVHWALDAEQACRIVLEIAEQTNCRHAVKSKSMTSEEIHLNGSLEEAGIEVTETDFGEFILQVAGQRPSHLVAPAVHHTRESIAHVLSQFLGKPIADSPKALAQAGRTVLRQKFREADLGITGANFAIAETGTIVLVTNEGNGRLTTTCPRVLVSLMGMEKVIPRLEHLAVFLKLLARAATGQTLSVYTTLITGPRREGEMDGPEEFHLVMLDNGRSRILGTPFRESLQCIRCGACLNACPVYRRIGGHAYGGVYSGPIGSILTPLFDSLRDYAPLPHASSLCGACQAACPVKINIPHMLIGLRLAGHRNPDHRSETLAYSVWHQVLRRPWLYQIALRITRTILLPFSRQGWLRRLPWPASGWTKMRDFPMPARNTFRELWYRLEK
jgi:L-lactate dehydrogenase complex protein LldF